MLNNSIPVCLPKLPVAEKVLPYLQQIDNNRWYSNFGPLHHEFVVRLAKLFNIKSTQLMCAANGTLILELCLKALGVQPGSLCIMPSWTFVATPLAAVAAGLPPFFVDVELESQSINPEKLIENLPLISSFGKIGAVVITAPFGRPVNIASWDKFTEKTGIPVVIDAAAAFDTILQQPEMHVSTTPMMVSLHATKIFGVGEGGILLSTNEDLIDRVESISQFGFTKDNHQSNHIGTNAKMNEYTCAIGLAALDEWLETRNNWKRLSNHYQQFFKETGIQHMLSPDWLTSVCNIIVPNQANALASQLKDLNISTRKWWGEGCHQQPIFKNSHQLCKLKNTDYLQNSVLGIPFYPHIENESISKIHACLSRLTLCIS